MLTIDNLIALGLATREPMTLSGAIRGAGQYLGTNGYSYTVAWNNGQMTVADVGFSPAYRLAEREWERLHGALLGPLDAETEARWECFLLLKAV